MKSIVRMLSSLVMLALPLINLGSAQAQQGSRPGSTGTGSTLDQPTGTGMQPGGTAQGGYYNNDLYTQYGWESPTWGQTGVGQGTAGMEQQPGAPSGNIQYDKDWWGGSWKIERSESGEGKGSETSPGMGGETGSPGSGSRGGSGTEPGSGTY